jgi:hypothetical protein
VKIQTQWVVTPGKQTNKQTNLILFGRLPEVQENANEILINKLYG